MNKLKTYITFPEGNTIKWATHTGYDNQHTGLPSNTKYKVTKIDGRFVLNEYIYIFGCQTNEMRAIEMAYTNNMAKPAPISGDQIYGLGWD